MEPLELKVYNFPTSQVFYNINFPYYKYPKN